MARTAQRDCPNLTRTAVLRDPSEASGFGQFAVIQAMAPASFGVGLTPIAREPNSGLIVTASASAVIHRHLIISQALRGGAIVDRSAYVTSNARDEIVATDFVR
jgi:hypothetical protein